MGKYRVAVDVGGTNTDVFIFNELSGDIQVNKVPSVPANPSLAIVAGIEKAGIPLSEVTLFSHGTTVGTNALITRNLPLTGMVNTKGFRDVIEIRRSTKEDLWDVYKDVAPPYVRRRDRLEVDERIDSVGHIVTPLNEVEARNVARLLKKKEVKAVAVCFINSYVNGIHENRMKEILEEELPGVFICTSSEILPEIFEHERFSTTVANAALGPVVGQYLRELTTRLGGMGYKGEVLVLHSGGGVMTADTVVNYAARIASSGIAAGAIASAHIARLCGYQNAIGLDMGGTSTDISLMYNGQVRITKEWQIEYGYPIMFPSIEVMTIGAGGGSIAWVDEGGSLRNGPQSAGADPGPACYMKGGTDPTNTDCNLVMGRLDTRLLAGEMTINKEAAEKAVKTKIADRFNFSIVEAANAITKVANANMCDAVRLISIRRGYDPREFALVAFGGGGSLHAAYLAREMEIPTVIVPRYPGITSAMGCLLVDVRHDLVKTYHADANKVSVEQLEEEYVELEKEAMELLQAEGTPPENMEFLRFADMRYAGQWRSLTVPVTRPIESLEHTLQRFHTEHQREYAWSSQEQGVQIYVLQVTAVGHVPKPNLPKYPKGGNAEQALTGTRQVYFEEADGFVETKVYQREDLPAGAIIMGPAIVEQLDSTVVIPPDVKAEVDEYLNIIMQIGKEGK